MKDVPESLDGETLAERIGVSVRTLRAWVKAGLIPRPPAHGHNTRFDRRAIVIAYAVAALRRDGVPLSHVSRFLKNKTEREVRELGGLPAPRDPRPMPALPADVTPTPALDAELVSPALVRAGDPHEPPIGTTWRRIELVPGLELHVRSDASSFAQGLAEAIAGGRLPK